MTSLLKDEIIPCSAMQEIVCRSYLFHNFNKRVSLEQ